MNKGLMKKILGVSIFVLFMSILLNTGAGVFSVCCSPLEWKLLRKTENNAKNYRGISYDY